MFSNDTIVALATAPLPAGVAVIRLSGRGAHATAKQLVPQATLQPGHLQYTKLQAPDGRLLDQAMVVYFKAPHSFTGEDVIEFHCHGGKAVIQGIIDAVLAQPKTRMATAGEFSRRAVLNGKMDLTAAEGVADLIAAETGAQHQQALGLLKGKLADQFEAWRLAVMTLVAHVEAAIDFPDEELDVIAEYDIINKSTILLNNLKKSIASDLGVRVRDGFRLAIIGRPNAGKSTLMNALSGEQTAIVSDIAGTTRDVVETHLNLGGYPVIIADTAGLRQAEDVIEQEGVRRAEAKALAADLRLIVVDPADWPLADVWLEQQAIPGKTLFVFSKKDIFNDKVKFNGNTSVSNIFNHKVEYKDTAYPAAYLSLHDDGVGAVLAESIAGYLEQLFSPQADATLVTRARHKEAVTRAMQHLQKAIDTAANPGHYSVSELVAQDLRDAASAIGDVTGRTSTEDVLDVVFSSFCVGK